MAADPEQVALLALIYRELHYQRYQSPDDLVDDFDVYPDGICLLTLHGSYGITDFDWELVRALEHPEQLRQALRDIEGCDARRCEALLHAWPEDAARPTFGVKYARRWERVEKAMEHWRDLGVMVRWEDVELAVGRAHWRATGKSVYEGVPDA